MLLANGGAAVDIAGAEELTAGVASAAVLPDGIRPVPCGIACPLEVLLAKGATGVLDVPLFNDGAAVASAIEGVSAVLLAKGGATVLEVLLRVTKTVSVGCVDELLSGTTMITVLLSIAAVEVASAMDGDSTVLFAKGALPVGWATMTVGCESAAVPGMAPVAKTTTVVSTLVWVAAAALVAEVLRKGPKPDAAVAEADVFAGAVWFDKGWLVLNTTISVMIDVVGSGASDSPSSVDWSTEESSRVDSSNLSTPGGRKEGLAVESPE